MNSDRSLPSSQREFERGFAWTLLLSLAAHLAIIAALVLAPGFVLRPQPQLRSYTVDLVDPGKLGGTNLIAGSKGRSAEPPKVEPAKAKPPEPPPPPPPKVEEPPPPPPEPEAKAPEPPPKPEIKPPEPPKPDEKAIAVDKKIEATPTRPQEVAKVEVPTVAKVPPSVTPTVHKIEPIVVKPTAAKAAAKATATTQPKAVAKPQMTPTKGQPEAVAKAQTIPAAKPNTTPGKPSASAAPAKGTPAVEPKGHGDVQARDDRIAAAIKRVEQQAGARGGGTGSGPGPVPGGPISLGPGEGAGGEVRSLATIMYTNRIQAMIKEKWAWAGAKSLKADIGFNILPSGDVTNVRTVASSGDATYDKLAELAVRGASPFPAPPEECAEEFETGGFLYTFEPE